MAPRTGILLLAVALAVAGCGDDDAGSDDAAPTSSVPTADADADETDADEAGDDPTTTTTVADAEAEDPPDGSGGEDEGATDDFVYVAELTGDAGGSGRAELRGGAPGELCADLAVTGLGPGVGEAHVHESQDGEAVVALGRPTTVDGDTTAWDDVCVPVDDAVTEALAANAPGFHVDVHTDDHPDGAVRGQLEFATIFDLELS